MSKKKTAEIETETPKIETDLADVETETKDLNESALQKVEEKHEEFVGDSKVSNATDTPSSPSKEDVDSANLAVVLVDAGWDGEGSVVAAARQLILSQNSEMQVLDTVLIANLIKDPADNVHPIESAVKWIIKAASSLNYRESPSGRKIAAGTKLQLSNETVTLAQDAVFNYPDELSEQKFVGLCVHSDNLEANRVNFRFRYSGLGVRLPLDEQVDSPEDVIPFISALTESEANSFGVIETWENLQVEFESSFSD